MSAQISELSKTYQYRKVMKPMLERKRRARINKCLDELKDLMVVTLESEGEHVTRLEKADILELTVSYLQKMKRQRNKRGAGGGGDGISAGTMTQAEGFRSGYIHAVNEVSRSLSALPGVNVHLGTQLMTHLGQRLNQIQPPAIKTAIPITSPLCVQIGNPTFRNNKHHRSYSVPLSPLSRSSTDSPTSTSLYNETQSSLSSQQHSTANASLLTTCPMSANASRSLQASEENVWRPW